MMIVFASIIIVLVILEYVTRKRKLQLDDGDENITREELEVWLDSLENLNYTYGKIFACHLEDLNLILIPKEEYSKSEQLVVMHEIGHFFHLSKIKETLRYKVLLYSKGIFYFLGIVTMFTLALSLLFNPLVYILKYLLILLIIIQVVHLVLLTYSEFVANTYISNHFKQDKGGLVYVYASMLSQIVYWFLFMMLTIVFYQFIFI